MTSPARSRSGSPAERRESAAARSRSRSRSRSPPRRRSASPRRRSRSRSRSRSRGRRRSPGADEEEIELDDGSVAYLLGRGGQTKQRLANFTGADLEINPTSSGRGVVSIRGSDDERKLARLCIDITLQQRNNSTLKFDVDELKARTELTTLDVEQEAVGFLLGAKGATLRGLEKKHRTFMFFDNDRSEVRTVSARFRPRRAFLKPKG